MDGSDSMTQDDFRKVKEFLKSIVSKFPISERDIHVALIEYSDLIEKPFGFLAYMNKRDVLRAIDRITPSRRRFVETDRVLREAILLFSAQAGGRPAAPKVLVVVTDDKSTGSESLRRAAEPLKKAGVRVFVVGIGSRVDPDDWKGVVLSEKDFIRVDRPDNVPTVAHVVESVIQDAVGRSMCGKCYCQLNILI